MAVTRLKRKGRRNKTTARVRVETIQRLNSKPVIKNVDVEKIKAGFSGTSAKAEKKEKAPAKKVEAKKETAPAAGDDLRKVEGIGPKIAEIFKSAGIDTFAKLAQTEVDKLKEILAEAGGSYKSKDPSTWPKQAEMAAEAKWDELKAWQDELNGGK